MADDDKPKGLIESGNLNLHNRPQVRNSDGSISTVRSLNFTDDAGREVLIPTVIGDRVVSNDQAVSHYYNTGLHLGIFDSRKNAETYGQNLHEAQQSEYLPSHAAGGPVTSVIPPSSDWDPNYQSGTLVVGSPPDEGKGGFIGDFARQAYTSALGMGTGLLGAVSAGTRALTGDPTIVRHIENLRAGVEDHMKGVMATMSPDRQHAAHSSLLGYFGAEDPETGAPYPTPGEVGWHNWASSSVASLLPMVPLMLGGIGPAATAARAIGFGAQNFGDAYNSWVKAIDKATPEEMAQSAPYQALRGQGLSDIDARKQLVAEGAKHFAAPTLAVGGLAGAGLAGVVRGKAGAALTEGLGKMSRPARAALMGGEAGALMGAQSGVNADVQQRVVGGTYDPTKTAVAFAAGALPGAAFGAAASMLHAGPRAQPDKGVEVDTRPGADVAPDHQAALSEALQIEPTTFNDQGQGVLPGMPGSQGEMFSTGAMGQPPPGPTMRGLTPGMPEQAAQPDLFAPGVQGSAPLPVQGEMFPRQPPGPSAAQQAIQTSQARGQVQQAPPEMNAAVQQATGGAPAPAVQPAAPAPVDHTAGMKLKDVRDALVQAGVVTKQVAGRMRDADARQRLSQIIESERPVAQPTTEPTSTAAPETTTVVKGSEPVAETPVSSPETSPPPVTQTSPGPEAAAPKPAPEPKPVSARAERKAKREAAVVDTSGIKPAAHVDREVQAKPDVSELAPATAPAEPTPEERKADLIKKVPEGFRVIKTRKGADIAPIVSRLYGEITEIIRRSDGRPDTVAKQLDEWADAHPTGHIPGTNMSVRLLADEVIRKATGVEPKPRESLAQAAAAEVEHAPKVFETEKAKREAVAEEATGRAAEAEDRQAHAAEGGEEAGHDLTTVATEAERTRSDQTTDITRIAGDHIEAVLEGRMSPREAFDSYGVPQKGGRQRREGYRTLAEVFANEARRARSDEARKDFLDLVEKDQQAKQRDRQARDRGEQGETANTRKARTEAIDKAGDRIGEDYARRMEDYAREMLDPVGLAADVQTRKQIAADKFAARKAERQAETPTLFHGSSQQFSRFDVDKGDIGIHLGTHDQASSMGAHIYAASFEPKKPLRAEEPEHGGWANPASAMAALEKAGVKMPDPIKRQIEVWSAQTPTVARGSAIGERQRQLLGFLRRVVQAAGYDSIVYRNMHEGRERADSVIALKPGDITLNRSSPPTEHDVLRQEVPGPEGLSNRLSSRYVRTAADPRVHHDIVSAIQASEQHGTPYTAQDALSTILHSSVFKAEQRPLWELARKLYDRVGDLHIVSYDEAQSRGYTSIDYGRNRGEFGTVGYYAAGRSTNPRHIGIKLDGPHVGQTVLHEILHSVTEDLLRSMSRNDRQNPLFKAIHAINGELVKHAQADRAAGTMPTEVWRGLLSANDNIHELHTWLMSNPELQAYAASKQASPEFRKIMSELGLAPREQGNSIWRYFVDWTRHALGLAKPTSASDYTLLDHIMRPFTDIIDAAVRHNERMLPRDPTLRDDAKPLMQAISSGQSPLRERVAERVAGAVAEARSGSANDRMRAVWMQGMSDDRMIDRWGHLYETAEGNLAEAHRAAKEKRGAASDHFNNLFLDKAAGIAQRLKGRDELAQLENDAGYGKAYLGNVDPKVNKHVDPALLNDLQTRYKRLSPEDQKLYQEHKQLGSQIYDYEHRAELDGTINKIMPDATAEQRKALHEAFASQEKLDAFLLNPDNSEVAKRFASVRNPNEPDWWTLRGSVVKGLAKLHSMGFVQGDYFKLGRIGDYVLVYGDKDVQSPFEKDHYGVEMFERRHEAEARRAELQRLGVPDVQGLRDRSRSLADQEPLPASTVVDELMDAVKSTKGLKVHAAELKDMLDDIRMRHMTSAEAARLRPQRKGIAGASTEASRILSQSVASTSQRIGNLIHGPEVSRTLTAMHDHTRDLARSRPDTHDAYVASQLLHEFRQKSAGGDAMQRGVAAFARKAQAFGFTQSLLSPSRMIVEALENTLRAGVWMGARHGYGATTLATTKALLELSPSMVSQGARNTLAAFGRQLRQSEYNLSEMARKNLLDRGYKADEVNAFFQHFRDTGLFDSTFSRTLQQMARASTIGDKWQRFLDVTGSMGHATEELTRIAPSWAAFRLERAKGASIDTAIKYADTVLRKSPNWNPALKPRISTDKGVLGRFAAPIMQFKLYGLNEYAVMANTMQHALTGATKEQRREQAWAMAGIIASHSLMAGTLTWLADPLRYIGGAWDFITGTAPQDRMPIMKNFLSDTFGQTWGGVIGGGVPRLAGIDLSQRTGVRNMLNIPELNGFAKKDWMGFLGQSVLGAAGEDAASATDGFFKLLHGDMTGFRDIAPRIARDVYKGATLATSGITDTQGRTTVAPGRLSPVSSMVQGFGFSPAEVSDYRAGRRAEVQARDLLTTQRRQLEERWLQADPVDRAAVMSNIREWNQSHHGANITVEQLLQLRAQRAKQARAPFDLRMTPKMRREIGDVGRFSALQ